MSGYFTSDGSNGGMNSSELRVKAHYTVRSQITVNRLFSIPRMARTINPTAETMNPAAGVQSDGSASSTSAGGASSPSGSAVSHFPLSFEPMTIESPVEGRTEEEVEVVEAADESTSTDKEPSEYSNDGFETASDTETRISPQASEQGEMDVASALTKEPSALEKAPEKEEKEEEKASSSHLAAEEEPEVPWLLEEEEPVDPWVRPDEQEAAPLPPEEKPSVPPLLPLLPRDEFPPEEELSLIWLPLDMEPSVIKFLEPEEQPSRETEPSVPPPLPESEQNVPQLPVEMEPSVSHLLLKKESPVSRPQVSKEPSLEDTYAPMLPITPQPQESEESLERHSLAEKSEAFNEPIPLRETAPNWFERPAFQVEKKAKIEPEIKAQPRREEILTSIPAYPVSKPATAAPGRKSPTLSDTVEDIATHLKEVSSASKSAMANSISSFVASPLGKVFAHTIDRALEKSEEWLDYYLPVPETEVEPSAVSEEEPDSPSEELDKEGCFMRISSLTTKVRNRAFRLAVNRLKTTRETAKDTLPVVDQLVDVLERHHGQNLLTLASIPEALHHLWTQRGSKQEQEPPRSTWSSRMSAKEPPSIVPEQLELKALDLTRTLAQQLYGTYRDLLPHVTHLPDHLQEKVIGIHKSMEDLQAHLTSSPSLRNLPSSIVAQSRQKMAMARDNLDEILDFMARNPASSWLSQPTSSPKGKQSTSATAGRQLRGRSPERKANEGGSTSRQPPSLPHL